MVIEYLIAIAIAQGLLLTKILFDAYMRRRKTIDRINEVKEIIPEIEKHPNPHLADLLWRMGNELNEDHDPYWRLVGSCLVKYYTLLNQEINRKHLHETLFIQMAQNAMACLEEAFRQDSKPKFAEALFKLSRILFEYPSVQEDLSISRELENALAVGIDYLRRKDQVVRSSPTLDLFRHWDFPRLRKADPYVRFVFVHTIQWCSQLPFEYKISGRIFLRKSHELADAVEKALRYAKNKDILNVYMVLCDTYMSLFPTVKQTKLSSGDVFFRPMSPLDTASEEISENLERIRMSLTNR